MSLLLALPAVSAFADTQSSDCLFNYFERNYAQHLQAASASQTVSQYYFRYYSGTNAYLGVDNSTQRLVYVGPLSGNGFLDLGAVSTWLPQASCSASTSANAVTTSFYDFNWLQDVNGTPVASGAIVDNGANVVGSVTFGTQGTSAAFIPQLNGNGYSWGSPMSYGNGYGSNPKDKNVPAVAAICQIVPNQGGARGKLTDVLVTQDATKLTNASQLANVTFNAYFEDCQQSAGETMSFDAAGNISVVTSSGSKSLTAAQATGALSGTPITTEGMTTFNAYSYVDSQSGKTRYVLIEHGSDKASGLTRGYLGIWLADYN
jgi:hypothetical protein